MRVLLDTHLLLWALGDPKRLSKAARARIDADHAAHVLDLPNLHRDPFDRMLIAQARHESMVLLTNDRVLAAYGPAVEVV
jgi:PIN domain nuclease of toxin-antitoxin system